MPPESEQDRIERLQRAMYSRQLPDKLRERDRRELSSDAPGAGSDWMRERPDLSKITVAPRSLTSARTLLVWVLVAAVAFFIAAVGYFVYFFTIGGAGANASAQNIDIVVSGPPQIPGGSPAELQVSVTNNNAVALQLADLVIAYPDGTKSASDFSTPEPSLRQDLGTIEPGQTRQGTVKAVFSGTSGANADVKVELEYRLDNSSAIFTKDADYAFTFSSSPLSIKLDGNTETVSGQPVQLTVHVASNASAPQRGILLQASYPFGFRLTDASPEASAPGVWNLGDLDPGQIKDVTLQGVLVGNQGDSRVFSFTAGSASSSAASTTIGVPLSSQQFALNISSPFLGLTLALNGSNSTSAVSPNGKVTATIDYVNNLSTPITDAVVVAKLSGVQIDGTTVQASEGFFRSSDDTILWSKDTDQDLATVAPGATGQLSFSFSIPDASTFASVAHPLLSISLNAAGDRLSETGVPESLQSALTKTLAISSALNLAANALYHASPYGATGPLPPKANQETTYAIVFTITNTSSEIRNAKVTATLPPYVRSTGKTSPSSEHVSFNQSTGQVTWDVGDIAPNTGLNGASPRQAAFEIGFTPSLSQIGQEPDLVQNVVLTGIDADTGTGATSTVERVTTKLDGDTSFSDGDATVVK